MQITDSVTQANTTDLRDVIVVGNNWDGTIDIYDPHTFQRIKKLNAVPDKEERLEELTSSIKAPYRFELSLKKSSVKATIRWLMICSRPTMVVTYLFHVQVLLM